MYFKNKISSFFLFLLLLSFPGCIKDQSANHSPTVDTEKPLVDETKNGDQTVIKIEMTNSKFLPDTITIPTGEPVNLTIVNKSTNTHSFTIGKIPDKKLDGFIVDLFKNIDLSITVENKLILDENRSNTPNNGMESKNQQTVRLVLQPRETGILSFTIPLGREGEWEMACFDKTKGKSNYVMGLRGIINVE